MSNLLKQVDGVSSHLRNVYLELVKEFDSVIFRWSKYGVPHLVITTKVSTFSVCYFRRSKIFKIFSPYPSGGLDQDKDNRFTVQEVVEYIKNY